MAEDIKVVESKEMKFTLTEDSDTDNEGGGGG